MKQTAIFAAAILFLSIGEVSPLSAARDAGIAAFNNSDYATALRELAPDAKAGDAKAQYYMGLLYARGHGVDKNPATAVGWFRKAAKQGHTEAQFDLGHMYHSGASVPQDDAKAVEWWQMAAESGDTFAQSSLADLYLDGKGVERNLVLAYKWMVLSEPRTQPRRVQWNSFKVRQIAKKLKSKELAKAQKLVWNWLRAQKK